jgi:excisionase family DNA binding protein
MFVEPKTPPITVTISDAVRLTGWGRSKIYGAIGNGEIEAVKDGNRTLIIYESIVRRVATLPRVGRDAGLAVPAALRKPRQQSTTA